MKKRCITMESCRLSGVPSITASYWLLSNDWHQSSYTSKSSAFMQRAACAILFSIMTAESASKTKTKSMLKRMSPMSIGTNKIGSWALANKRLLLFRGAGIRLTNPWVIYKLNSPTQILLAYGLFKSLYGIAQHGSRHSLVARCQKRL